MSVPKHWLLGGWYPRVYTVHTRYICTENSYIKELIYILVYKNNLLRYQMYSYLFSTAFSMTSESLTDEGSQGSNPQSSSARSQVADKRIPLGGGCHVMIQKGWPWTIVGNVFGECHTPCTLKNSFCRFRKKRVGAL